MDETITSEQTFGSSGTETAGTYAGEAESRTRRPRQRLILAGIGAVAAACDSAEETFDRLVDRGARVQDDVQERAQDFRRQNSIGRGRMRDYFRNAMDAVLDGLSVPNKADVDTINVKLNILTRKIDDLQLHEAQAADTTIPPAPAAPPTGDLAT